jgi:hypothetical protein
MSKTYTIVGIATKDGAQRMHVSNGSAADRVKILTRQGWTDIKFFDLPAATDRDGAAAFLSAQGIVVAAPAKPARTVKPARAAKPARTSTDVVKVTKAAKTTKSKVRVGDKPRAGQSVEEFVNLWFADKAEKAEIWRANFNAKSKKTAKTSEAA